METLEECFEAERALVFGAGCCGDVVSAVPTARMLEAHGVEVLLGGVAWERAVVDPRPGPRSFEEIDGIERLNDAVALASEKTRTHDGVEFAETHVARHYGEDVALIDLAGGAAGVARGLDDACGRLDLDLVVGTDAGGDVLAAGHEPGIASPLTDALMLAALSELETEAALGVFGYGSDGELTLPELDDAVARAAARGGLLGAWGLTPRVVDELEGLLEVVTTEASRLPVGAALGDLGEVTIRDGDRTAELTPASTVTFYFDPATVAETSSLDEHVRGTESFEAAQAGLSDAGYVTELERERELAESR